MKIRKITSLTATLAFILMVLTSVVLYVVPQGRVAYWADWRLWGLSKTEWGNIHINLGLLFLIALFLHIYYNWKPLMSYLKDKTRKMKILTPEFNVALVITIAAVVGTYLLVPPFSWIMALNDHLKEAGAAKYGEPPYGHAELSTLQTFAQKMGLDIKESMAGLEKAGFRIENNQQTLADLGRRHNVPPQKIYQAMKTAADGSPVVEGIPSKMPDAPPPGTGNLTLTDLLGRYNLSATAILSEIKRSDLTMREDMTLKAIAEANHLSPLEIYELIRKAADVAAAHGRP